MRLSAIRLSGFKSFVDRTQLTLASNLTAVVGPNGCGKSNIIDAVRWVLGESSARQLRGEALSDVIFNGSKTRKPVGRAMIELVFDNSDGTISGPYASYAEISVRRELSREGQSNFLINGTRCRRKDIHELFLGTGLGARSNYAIIEQGTVSRLIEAQPEELRQMLEETAGISRYKEKRRETEHRIRHTRENLSRLEDLLGEIDERLAKLERQAAAASRFKRYRAEQRTRRRQLFGLRWQALEREFEQVASVVAAARERLDAGENALAASTRGRTEAAELAEQAAANSNQAQADFYAAEGDLARCEQDRKHAAELLDVRKQESESLRQEAARLRSQRVEREAAIESLAGSLNELEKQLAELKNSQSDVDQRAESAEAQLQARSEKLNDLRQRLDEPRTIAATERVRLEQLQRQFERAEQRGNEASGILEGLDFGALGTEIAQADGEKSEATAAVERLEQAVTAARERVTQLRQERAAGDDQLHEARKTAQALHARAAALKAEQARALGQQDDSARAWLDEQGWGQSPALGAVLKVESGWERAVEAVLGPWLQALCIPDDPGVGELPGDTGLALVHELTGNDSFAQDSLASRVTGPAAARRLLARIYTADGRDALRQRLTRLAPGEAVVGRDGVIHLAGALRADGGGGEEDGVLLRARMLEELEAEEKAAQEVLLRVQQAQEQRVGELQQAEERQQQLFGELNESRKRQVQGASRVDALRERFDMQKSRQARAEQDLAEASALKTQLASEQAQARQQLAEAEAAVRELESSEQALANEHQELRASMVSARESQNETRQRAEALREKRIAMASELAAARAGVESLGSRAQQLEEAIASADQGRAALEAPLPELAQKVERAHQRRDELGVALKQVRTRQEEAVAAARSAAEQVLQAEQIVRKSREALSDAQFGEQRVAGRRESLLEQLTETGAKLEEVVAEVEEGQVLTECEEELTRLDQRIQRLGAVNLAAVEEFDKEKERAEYLRTQEADLLEALAKLEDAIGQIDRETRTRFKTTYEAVNEKFKARFPRLFGGGEAYLELTGDDILEAGVRVMARPPGKRNSSIQLLSGGEKALTAVSLVFALFELNPAPFCLLDEVDAPLDDANVVRFCEVVKEMSEQIQFIVVTHNKVTMELAEQLNGVTMQEPGVSRLVSVDVQQAVAMAG